MERWLAAALDYLPRWLEHQLRVTRQPGLSLAVALHGKPLLELALGHADLARRTPLTPRHRFRVASHSKTFTAAALMRLREAGRLQLDDPVGRHVSGLHPQVAALTLAQLLSHSGGLVRDGGDSGQWLERRPFLDETELRADLAAGPLIEPNTRFKYSNHGYGLLGLVLQSVTGKPYGEWVARDVVAAAGLAETLPDVPESPTARKALRLAHGHTAEWPLGRRLVVKADMSTRALASATGFVSTAADLARFYSLLSPQAPRSLLSVASRRELTRRQWREPHASAERWYGLGTMSGTLGGWEWFGHTGGFPGTLSRSCCVPAQGLGLSILSNAADGLAGAWVDGALHLLQAFRRHGAPTRSSARWAGRWWSLWGATDLLPVADKVLVANPGLANPVLDAAEIGELSGSRGRIVLANGYAQHGEPAALHPGRQGLPTSLQLAGMRLWPEAQAAEELRGRYGRGSKALRPG